MQITKAGSQPSGKGPADWFTGTVRIDPLFTAPTPARAAGAAVTFEPGARTAWHTHPLGQTLIVTFGRVDGARHRRTVWRPNRRVVAQLSTIVIHAEGKKRGLANAESTLESFRHHIWIDRTYDGPRAHSDFL